MIDRKIMNHFEIDSGNMALIMFTFIIYVFLF